MLSRTASSLYWLGRYFERADFIARLVEATVRLDVLRGSRARSLYLRHGFVHESEDDVDEVLVRRPRTAADRAPAT